MAGLPTGARRPARRAAVPAGFLGARRSARTSRCARVAAADEVRRVAGHRRPRADRRSAHLRARRHRRHHRLVLRAALRLTQRLRRHPRPRARRQLEAGADLRGVAHPAVLLPRHRGAHHPLPHPRRRRRGPRLHARARRGRSPSTGSAWSAGSAACAARSQLQMQLDARPDYGRAALRRAKRSGDGVLHHR